MRKAMNKIKQRIKKLLTLAGDPSAEPGEITNAMKAARKLMIESGISRDDLEDAEFIRLPVEGIGRKLSTWEAGIISVAINLVGYVQAYQEGSSVVFYGPKAGVEQAAETYRLLRDTIHATAMLLYGSWFRGDGALYAQGYSVGLHEAHQKCNDQLHEEDTAIVLQDERKQRQVKARARAWLNREANIKVRNRSRKRNGARRGNLNAFLTGREDGRQHNTIHQ